MSAVRDQAEDLRFESQGDECAAFFERPEGDASCCVVMSNGFSLGRLGLDPYSDAFVDAGCATLRFDYRFLGDSGGEPRGRITQPEQLDDVRAAIDFARAQDGIDPDRIVLWGYSMGGAHSIKLAVEDQRIAGAILLCPYLNGAARLARTPPKVGAWLAAKMARAMAGQHVLVPLAGEPGEMAIFCAPGEAEGIAKVIAERGVNPPDAVSPDSFVSAAVHQPWRHARRVSCPLWIGKGERDVTVRSNAPQWAAGRAPRGEVHFYDTDHWEPFLGDVPAQIAGDQIDFLQRSGLLS